METEALKCSACEGALDYNGTSVCVCPYCGVTNILSGNSIKYVNRLNRAIEYRLAGRFDDADKIYDEILDETAPTVDVLWSKALCRYGITYVEDPVTHENKPTLNRIEDEDIFDCDAYIEAMEIADEEQKNVLQSEAQTISDIQNGLMDIVKNEEPYDVFICYKETDAEGKRTVDSVKAQQLYDLMTKDGLKVFFSRVTLQDKLGVQFEPYIFAALKSATVMILLATDTEYIQAPWVKNEWSRFLQLKKENPQKGFFIACPDPSLLPRNFKHFEVQNLTEVGAEANLAFNTRKYIEKVNPNRSNKGQNPTFVNVDSFYKVAFELNRSGKYEESNEKLTNVINLNPAFTDAYMLRICNNTKVSWDDLENCSLDFTTETDYITAMNLADAGKQKEYSSISDNCIRNKNACEQFMKKKSGIIREYREKKRGADQLKKVKALEKEYRSKSDANAFVQEDRTKKALVGGIILFGIYLLISLYSFSNLKVDASAASIWYGIGLLSCGTGLIFMASFLRGIWATLLGFGIFGVYIFGGIFLGSVGKSDSPAKWIIPLFVFNLFMFVVLTAGWILYLQRPKMAQKKSLAYNAVFRDYSSLILKDIKEALDQAVSERGHSFRVPFRVLTELDRNNYRLYDRETIGYLDEICVYANFALVFDKE